MKPYNDAQLTVQDALGLPSFADAHVLAGKGGLDREITGAMVLEAPDIESWGKRGMAILTSYFALANLSEAQLESFFDTVSGIGISCLIFKPKRLVASVPTPIVSLCENYGIPLVVVSADVVYDQILLDVMGRIINANMTLLNRFYEVHKQTMELALKHPSVMQVLMNLKGIVDVDSTFLNVTDETRVSSNASLGAFRELELAPLESGPYQAFEYFRATLSYAQGRRKDVVAVLVPSPNTCDTFYLVVHRDADSLSMLDVMTIENIVSMLQTEVLKQDAIAQKLFIQNNNTVHDLLLGRCSQREKVDAALSNLNIDAFSSYEVLLVLVSGADHANEAQLADLLTLVRKRLKALYPSVAYYETNDRVCLLHNFGNDRDRFSLERIQAVLNKLHEDANVPDFVHLAALSRKCDRYHISEVNNEVIDIYKLFNSSRWHNHCIRYDNLGFYKLLLRADDASNLLEYVDQRVLDLRADNPELLDTLVVLCENSLNFQETAKRMFLHPKTIHYRVDRVRELVGLDVRDPDDYLQVMLASKVLSLFGDREG